VLASVDYALPAGAEVEFLRNNAGATGLTLTGNGFGNTIVGGAGDDTIIGGAGDDVMLGGRGNDVFAFFAGFGHDTINDFDANPLGGQDLLDISGLGITAATFAGLGHDRRRGQRVDHHRRRLDQAEWRQPGNGRRHRLQARALAKLGIDPHLQLRGGVADLAPGGVVDRNTLRQPFRARNALGLAGDLHGCIGVEPCR
jgi:hypothetical protein